MLRAAFALILDELWFKSSVNTVNALDFRVCRVSTNMQKCSVSKMISMISSTSCLSRSTSCSMRWSSKIASAPNGSSETISIVLCEFFLAITSSSSNSLANTGMILWVTIAFRPLLLPLIDRFKFFYQSKLTDFKNSTYSSSRINILLICSDKTGLGRGGDLLENCEFLRWYSTRCVRGREDSRIVIAMLFVERSTSLGLEALGSEINIIIIILKK